MDLREKGYRQRAYQDMSCGTGLTQSVPLPHRGLEPLPNSVNDVLSKGCSGRYEVFDGGKVVVVHYWSFAES